MEISIEEFVTILKEEDKYEKMKENLRNVNEKLSEKSENMRLNSFNLRSLEKWVNDGWFTQVVVLTTWKICKKWK